MKRFWFVLSWMGVWFVCGAASAAESNDAIFQKGVEALQSGAVSEAISAFETLADRGVVDASVSLNRGLAYAMRIRERSEEAGDFGQAASAFEEVRDLSTDAKLAHEAGEALDAIRSEVARRRMRAGAPAEIEQRAPLTRSIVRVASEDTWCVLAVFVSLLFALSLLVGSFSARRRVKLAAMLSASVLGPALFSFAALASAAASDRVKRHPAVVIAPGVRLADARGVTLSGVELPEAARVDVVEEKLGQVRLQWGEREGWVADGAVRRLSRPEL